MFGMGFSELLIIAVIAILFLGPDKLPSTLVEIAKFFRSMKQTVNNVKESIDQEIHLEDIKKEAEAYKQQLLEAQSTVNRTVNLNELNNEINSIIDDEEPNKQTKKTHNNEQISQTKENKDA
jgi:sec-independent protein translocase protein TatB